MGIDKTIEQAFKYLPEYADAFGRTFANPAARFDPVYEPLLDPNTNHAVLRARFSPKVVAYVVVSAIAGILLNTLTVHDLPEMSVTQNLVLVVCFWAFWATIIHLLCRALRGRGSYSDTMSVALQLLATMYVVSGFLTIALLAVENAVAGTHHWFSVSVRIPVLDKDAIHFSMSLLLTAIYLPIALKRVHGFGAIRTIVVSLPALLIGLVIASSVYILTGPPAIFVNPAPHAAAGLTFRCSRRAAVRWPGPEGPRAAIGRFRYAGT